MNSHINCNDVQKVMAQAEQGNADAQLIVGFYYEGGIEVGKDPKKAVEWYEKAAELGYGKAQRMLIEENLI